MAGGGGTYSGGVELSVSEVGLDPVKFVTMTVDSGGVRVAIGILKELKGRGCSALEGVIKLQGSYTPVSFLKLCQQVRCV